MRFGHAISDKTSFEMLCKLMYMKMIQESKDLFGLKDFGHLTIQLMLVLIGLAIFYSHTGWHGMICVFVCVILSDNLRTKDS